MRKRDGQKLRQLDINNGITASKMEAVGERLAALRAEKGVSRVVVADFCGTSRETIFRLEKGSFLPRADTLLSLANYYGVSADWILGKEK